MPKHKNDGSMKEVHKCRNCGTEFDKVKRFRDGFCDALCTNEYKERTSRAGDKPKRVRSSNKPGPCFLCGILTRNREGYCAVCRPKIEKYRSLVENKGRKVGPVEQLRFTL